MTKNQKLMRIRLMVCRIRSYIERLYEGMFLAYDMEFRDALVLYLRFLKKKKILKKYRIRYKETSKFNIDLLFDKNVKLNIKTYKKPTKD